MPPRCLSVLMHRSSLTTLARSYLPLAGEPARENDVARGAGEEFSRP
ncbi:hypothetical protein [Methanoculleus sp.]|nr:hypothetical protein [Methanoculleus sp.]MCK9318348.1 hypothetical protein [Methanoculleus sp.]